jgi:hypothetical protein
MSTPIEQMATIGEVRHAWSITEYTQHERGIRWYMAMSVFMGACILFGLFSQNFLFALIIILFAIILFLQSRQRPAHIDFAITDLGIVVGTRFYDYDKLGEFYVIYNPPLTKQLYIETNGMMRPDISISLEDENPIDIRNTLKEFLPENLTRDTPPFSDAFGTFWKIH